MLWYIIDGWNLIHKVIPLKKSPFPQNELITYIKRNKFTGSKNNRVSIVFDGRGNRQEFKKEREFEIVFSEDKTADEVIKNAAQRHKNKKQLRIVSDDREIIDFVKMVGAGVLKIDDFVKANKSKKTCKKEDKKLSYSLERKINEELSSLWLKKS